VRLQLLRHVREAGVARDVERSLVERRIAAALAHVDALDIATGRVPHVDLSRTLVGCCRNTAVRDDLRACAPDLA